jgi:hypothetical protein
VVDVLVEDLERDHLERRIEDDDPSDGLHARDLTHVPEEQLFWNQLMFVLRAG